MSFETIKIHRDFPVINGYVQAPPNLEQNKTKTNADSADTTLRAQLDYNIDPINYITLGSGRITKHGVIKRTQSWIRLPGLKPDEWYTDKSGDSINPADLL